MICICMHSSRLMKDQLKTEKCTGRIHEYYSCSGGGLHSRLHARQVASLWIPGGVVETGGLDCFLTSAIWYLLGCSVMKTPLSNGGCTDVHVRSWRLGGTAGRGVCVLIWKGAPDRFRLINEEILDGMNELALIVGSKLIDDVESDAQWVWQNVDLCCNSLFD